MAFLPGKNLIELRQRIKPLYQLLGLLQLVLKRQIAHLGLTLLALLSIIVAIGLVTNASFFSRAVDRVILMQEMEKFSKTTGRPPFSTSVYFFPTIEHPMPLEEAEKFSGQISRILTSNVGLPLRHLGIQASSGGLMLQPAPESKLYGTGKKFLGTAVGVYVANVGGHIKIDGQAYTENGSSPSSVLEVWMYTDTALTMGINLGETLMVGSSLSDPQQTIVKVVGFWKSAGADNEFWFSAPEVGLSDALLVRRKDYIRFLQPTIPSGTKEVDWYIILDERQMSPARGAAYLDGFKLGLTQINSYLPGAKLNMAPLDPLAEFLKRGSTLTVLLMGYNLPALIILLNFLVLTAGIITRWQRSEISILVSRGLGIAGVLFQVFLEEIILFIPGVPLGIAFGMLIARFMGNSASFMTFTDRTPLPVGMEGLSIPFLLLALIFSMLSRLISAAQIARQSKVTEEREWARATRAPFWYRYFIDVILLVPTFYAYDQMMKKGSLSNLIISRPQDIYQDPLLILVPALYIITISLVTIRLFAFSMRVLDLIASRLPWLSFHLALRQLGRQSHDYLSPLLLVIVSLAMGVYTISMAASLDKWLVDRMYYQVGSDLAITPQSSIGSGPASEGGWIPLPSEFQSVKGVLSAARVGDAYAIIRTSDGKEIRGRFLAIDRLEFPLAAWFRSDFSRDPLADLMNRLGNSEDSILVSTKFLNTNNLSVGSRIPIEVSLQSGESISSEFTIAGTYDYFPTVYEDNAVTIIGNIENLSTQFWFSVPFNIWIKLEPGVNTKTALRSIQEKLNISFSDYQSAGDLVILEQSKMERAGIFGTLTSGFLASTLIAILGLLIYSYASLRESVFRFSVLQAIGALRAQIISQVVMEYSILSAFGVVAGSAVGMAASKLFIPFFRYTGGKGVPLPPLVPIIAQQDVLKLTVIFILIVLAAEVLTIGSSLRQSLAKVLRA